MLRFFFGLLIVQIATVALVLLAPDDLHGIGWLRLIIPILVVGFFSAFWFAAMEKHKRKEDLLKVQAAHAKEREKIQVNAERAKTRLVQKTQQQIAREAKITHSKANFKVGAAFAAAIGAGALMLLTELLTLGMLTLSTAGGALGGYLVRARRGEQKLLDKLETTSQNNSNKSDIKLISNKK